MQLSFWVKCLRLYVSLRARGFQISQAYTTKTHLRVLTGTAFASQKVTKGIYTGVAVDAQAGIISCAKNSVGGCVNHYVTVSCTSSPDVNLRAFMTVRRCENQMVLLLTSCG